MNQPLSVLNTEVRTYDGLYSLNDLHRAAGGAPVHHPTHFLRTMRARKLIEEIEASPDTQRKAVVILRGRHGGTYACKELAYAYVMWTSVEYHLAALRALAALGAPAVTGGGHTVLVTVEDGCVTRMRPLGDSEVVIDPAKLPEDLDTIIPGWRAVPVRDVNTIIQLVLDGLEALRQQRIN